MSFRVEHVVEEQDGRYVLVSESFTDDGRGAAKHTLRWDTEQAMLNNLEAAKKAAEEFLAKAAKEAPRRVYAGELAVGAVSRIRRINLPFRRLLAVGRFTGHEYDEARLVVGPVQATVSVKLTGGFYWNTLKVTRNENSEMLFGIGGASSAVFISFTKAHS